jgi:hypothetical protein
MTPLLWAQRESLDQAVSDAAMVIAAAFKEAGWTWDQARPHVPDAPEISKRIHDLIDTLRERKVLDGRSRLGVSACGWRRTVRRGSK